jgi:hypothetical protein
MSAKTNDTLYLAIGGLAIVGAGVWAFVQQSAISDLRTPVVPPQSGAAYEATALKIVTPETRRWADAPPQSAGERWIYDVFTPPKIYYNTQTKQFTVVPPVYAPPPPTTSEESQAPAGFGIELVKVEQPLFRLQLVGYVGEGAQARGNFLNVETGAVVFGATGKKIPELNLEIVHFSAERKVVPQPGGTTLVYTEVSAVVRDTVTGVETTLDHRNRVPDGPLTVTLKSTADGSERTVKSGESFILGDVTYKVGDLVLDPPSAVVTREGGTLSAPETQTLVIPPPPPPPSNEEGYLPDGGTGTTSAPVGTFPGF